MGNLQPKDTACGKDFFKNPSADKSRNNAICKCATTIPSVIGDRPPPSCYATKEYRLNTTSWADTLPLKDSNPRRYVGEGISWISVDRATCNRKPDSKPDSFDYSCRCEDTVLIPEGGIPQPQSCDPMYVYEQDYDKHSKPVWVKVKKSMKYSAGLDPECDSSQVNLQAALPGCMCSPFVAMEKKNGVRLAPPRFCGNYSSGSGYYGKEYQEDATIPDTWVLKDMEVCTANDCPNSKNPARLRCAEKIFIVQGTKPPNSCNRNVFYYERQGEYYVKVYTDPSSTDSKEDTTSPNEVTQDVQEDVNTYESKTLADRLAATVSSITGEPIKSDGLSGLSEWAVVISILFAILVIMAGLYRYISK